MLYELQRSTAEFKDSGLTSLHEAQKEDYEGAKLGDGSEDGSESDVDCDGMSINLE